MTKTELEKHEYYMQKCIVLGTKAKHRGDSPVGCIIVKEDVIIGVGVEGNNTHKDITYHAEIEAVRNATKKQKSQNLSSCIMYTTHEPCIMCSYVIRHAKISLVVSGITIPSVGGISSKYPLLLDTTIDSWDRPPKTLNGILERECLKLHQ